MRNLAIMLLCVSLASCATGPSLGEYQSQCLSQEPTFESTVNCINQKIAADPDRRNHPLILEYSLYAQTLVEDVRNKKANETDAKLLLVQKYNQIKSMESQQNAAVEQRNMAIIKTLQDANNTKPYKLQPYEMKMKMKTLQDNSVHCTSYGLGNQVQTVCQ